MPVDIGELRAIAANRDRYAGQLDRLRKADKQTTCVEAAVASACDTLRDTLWCAFSRLIITKQAGASLAMDLSHSRPHKAFETAPIKPFNKFLDATAHVLKNCIRRDQEGRGPATQVSLGDARKLPIESGTIDLILTSPPYLNAIDYMRCSKFTLVWMGYTVSELANTFHRRLHGMPLKP